MNNRTAIVTGASKGIGAALAKRLATDGFKTIVNYSSSESDAMAVVGAIQSAGGQAKAIHGDVSKIPQPCGNCLIKRRQPLDPSMYW